MTRRRAASFLLAILLCAPATARAAAAVFEGDPVDPATGLPHEILPGLPLVRPGADGLLGTANDLVDGAILGDIDLVVRSGSVAATAVIPPPAAQVGTAALPVGIAGSGAAGGLEVPFTVFLSDGAGSAAAPAGNLLAAGDMDDIPVVVATFADLDRDGFIGPTDSDVSGSGDNGLEVRELEPVGRAAALFASGVARGTVAVRAGLPASQGGLTVALTALALTGPFDPNFYGGTVPSGPAISTALPFLPQRDLGRLIRDRAAPVGPTTTLQQVVQFAAVPSPSAGAPFALRLDGSDPTIDAALVNSQAAVGVAFREDIEEPALQLAVADLAFGTRSPANRWRVRLVPVDRWGNPADPAPGLAVSLQAVPPLQIFRPARARAGRGLILRSADGVLLRIKVPRATTDQTKGVLTVERDGVVQAAFPYSVDSRANRPKRDLTVPSRQASTIQAAVDGVTDHNRDGTLVVEVAAGLYRENVAINRPVILRGKGAGTTVLQSNGVATTIELAAPGASVRGLTAVGGSTGIMLAAATTEIVEARAWRNSSAGITVSGAGAQLWRVASDDNGGDGLQISGAADAACSNTTLIDNRGGGAVLSGVQGARFEDNQLANNAGGGISLVSVDGSNVANNQSANNLGSGLEVFTSQSNQIVGNLLALNDEDGVSVESTTANLISGNLCEFNHGYGLFVRRSTGDDFAAAPGVQPPPGDNSSANNRKGDVFVRPD